MNIAYEFELCRHAFMDVTRFFLKSSIHRFLYGYSCFLSINTIKGMNVDCGQIYLAAALRAWSGIPGKAGGVAGGADGRLWEALTSGTIAGCYMQSVAIVQWIVQGPPKT